MAMGIVSDKDFDKEKDKLSTPVPIPSGPIVGKVTVIEKGRGLGSLEVPDSLRQVIGVTANEDGRSQAIELAKSFGISPSSVSAYTKGATSTASYDETPNNPTIQRSKDRISKRARIKLMRAITHITEGKLAASKARDLAGIAKDMSAVVKSLEAAPTDNNGAGETSGPTFVFYAPQFKKEDSYDIVIAKE